MISQYFHLLLCLQTLLPCLALSAFDVVIDATQGHASLNNPVILTVVEPLDDGTQSCQWLKNGRVIPGQTGFTLEIPEARPQDAGYYQARVTDAEGNSGISMKKPVVIMEGQEQKITGAYSYPVVLQPRFWGPVDRIFWVKEFSYAQPEILKDTWWVRGTQTSRLRLLSRLMFLESVSCMAMVGESTVLLGSFRFDQFGLEPRKPRFQAAPTDVDAVIGQSIDQPFLYHEGGTIAVSGLPPGVEFGVDNLWGIPTKAGNYRLQWKLMNSAGRVTDSSQSWIFVRDPINPAPAVIPGLWAGSMSGSFGEVVGRDLSHGIIEILTSSRGVFSGSFRAGHLRWPLAGALRWDGEYFKSKIALAPPYGFKSFICILYAHAMSSDLHVSFEVEFKKPWSDYNPFWELSGELMKPRSPDSADVMRPTSNWRLSSLLQTENYDGYALGHGFITAVSAQRIQRMNFTGTLPDGSGIMGSMPVVSQLPLSVIFYQPLQKSGENLWGDLYFIGLPQDDREVPVLQGSLNWQRKPVEGKGWLAGRATYYGLNVTGEMFFRPDSGPLLPSTLPGTETFIRLNGGSVFDEFIPKDKFPFDLKPNHQAVFPIPDPRSFKLDIFAATGFFSGSFKLIEGSEGALQKSRTIHFRGLMIPGLSRGGGFFHFKSPSPSIEDASVFYSGAVDIFRPDDDLAF